jgi:hypothetical protein
LFWSKVDLIVVQVSVLNANKGPSKQLDLAGPSSFYLIAPVAATVTTSATASVFPWASFVDGERSSVRFFAVQGVNGRLGLIIIAHLDKPEAFRAARVPIHDDLGGLNRTMRRKHGLQIGVRHTIRQVSDIQLRSHNGPPSGKIT